MKAAERNCFLVQQVCQASCLGQRLELIRKGQADPSRLFREVQQHQHRLFVPLHEAQVSKNLTGRFNFEKLEALFEIWSREGKLLHTELWGPREFNYEEFTGMVGDGAEWVVRSSDTGEKVARFSYSPENRYTAHIGDELHHLDDEVEMMEIMEEHLGGIRTVCCHCMDGCAQCDGLGFRIEKIEEVDEDAV